jgi:AGZA family xanthine/uracil permease-like MFS transporter
MILMPLTYSISNGIVFGTIAYVALKLMSGKQKDITVMMYILAVFFLFKLVSPF